jgi:hypothetical protein
VIASVVSWAIGLAFVWSIVLYLLAIFVRERRQEAGLIYTFGGAILFAVVFSDRLRITTLHLRAPLNYLPGVTTRETHFSSSIVALIILAVLYVFRILVFHRLIATPPALSAAEPQTSAAREAINDLIAPSLAFYSFAVCLVSLVHGCYHLNSPITTAVTVALLLLYYLPILRYIIDQITALTDATAVILLRLWKYLKKIPLLIIVALVSLESFRRSGRTHSSWLAQWAINRLEQIDRDLQDSASREEETLRRLARPLLGGTSPQADSEEGSDI